MKEHRQLKNNEFFKTSIRQVSKNHYFFPTDQLYQFSCIPSANVEDVKDVDSFAIGASHEAHSDPTSCTFNHLIKPKV